MKPTTLLALSAPILAAATGQIREYNLTLQATYMSKDGNGRPYLTINGDTPGPNIEGDEGDLIRVRVENKMFIEATLHWHGIYQVDKYWNDGVPGVTQWPIESRGSYTYEFTLTNQSGIYFYHGHFGPAFADGQRGPLWIRPAPWRPRPYELIAADEGDLEAMRAAERRARHLMVSDWNYEPMDILTVMFRDAGATPSCAASIVINGKGRTTCLDPGFLASQNEYGPRDSLGCLSPPLGAAFMNSRNCKDTFTDFEVVQAEKGEKYLWLNFIHPGAHHELRISIDEHDMYIVAADGDFVRPKKVQAINVNMGERISVLVPLNQKASEYAIRVSSLSIEQIIQGVGVLRYSGVTERREDGVMVMPHSRPYVDALGNMISSGVMMDEMADLVPFPNRPPPPTSDHEFRFAVKNPKPAEWLLASEPHQGFRQQIPPILWSQESRGETTLTGLKNGTTIDIVFENHAQAMHPFHKHNHKAWIIGQGTGYFHWKDVVTAIEDSPQSFNLVDPPFRDGYRLAAEPGSWTVIRYTITFPAISMLHCHRIAHFAAGQQIVLIEGEDLLSPPPDSLRNLTHANFIPPVRYGPLD